jgi:hypothetical protein
MIGRERRKWTPWEKTPAVRRKCFGNGNFLIRLLLAIMETVEALTEFANHVHGKRAARRKRGKSFFGIFKITIKAI